MAKIEPIYKITIDNTSGTSNSRAFGAYADNVLMEDNATTLTTKLNAMSSSINTVKTNVDTLDSVVTNLNANAVTKTDLPVASTDNLGCIKVGYGFSPDENGNKGMIHNPAIMNFYSDNENKGAKGTIAFEQNDDIGYVKVKGWDTLSTDLSSTIKPLASNLQGNLDASKLQGKLNTGFQVGYYSNMSETATAALRNIQYAIAGTDIDPGSSSYYKEGKGKFENGEYEGLLICVYE